MTMRTPLRLSPDQYDELKRRQAQLLRSDIKMSGAQRSRSRNSQPMSYAEAVSLIKQIKAAFR
jgi:hypothetical protein